jgi:hypothetical protein
VVPVLRPGFGVGIHEQERKAAVRETRIPQIWGQAVHPKVVFTTKIKVEPVVGNIVPATSSALRPCAVIAIPPLSTILLPSAMPAPTTLLLSSALLLPCNWLRPATLRFLALLAWLRTLCLLRLLLPSLLRPLLLWQLLLRLLDARLQRWLLLLSAGPAAAVLPAFQAWPLFRSAFGAARTQG